MDNTSTIDIDLEAYSKEELIAIIVASNKREMTIEQFFVHVLTKACEDFLKEDNQNKN
jgi:hypothetical protein